MSVKMVTADPLFSAGNALGEGPLWHPLENRLYWVDINESCLYLSTEDFSNFKEIKLPTSVSAFGFQSGGSMILAGGLGFSRWQVGQPEPQRIWNPLPGRDGVRMNDGKVDPAGRFWAGSMDIKHKQGQLYRLDPDGTQNTLLGNIGISNGLGWSPDCKTMYYTDSLQYTIFSFDFTLADGNIKNQQIFIELPKTTQEIVPDGLCVDKEGCVWSAQWNGWQVVRYSPQGTPLLSVKVPAQRVTSCCFGGENSDLLFITSARDGFSEGELASQPHAGGVFIYQTETQGQITNFFGQTQP